MCGDAGKVPLTRKAIAQLIGKVFIQKSAVNLLSTVLDTPEFFWSAPDSMQVGYCAAKVGYKPSYIQGSEFEMLWSITELTAIRRG